MSKPSNLAITIIVIVLMLDAVLFLVLLPNVGAVKEGGVVFEALKVLMQLAAVGVAGGIITALLAEVSKSKDRDAARLQAEADVRSAMNEFRRLSITRLVGVTNVVRKAPLLIESHQSKKTYGEQMREILDARLELSLLRHDIESNEAFSKRMEIGKLLSNMEHYLAPLLDEWRLEYLKMPVPPEQSWSVLQALPILGDLRKGDEKGSGFDERYLLHYKEALRMMRFEIFDQATEDRQ